MNCSEPKFDDRPQAQTRYDFQIYFAVTTFAFACSIRTGFRNARPEAGQFDFHHVAVC